MRSPFALLILVAAAANLTAGPIPKEKPKSKDIEAIQGTWAIVEVDGRVQPTDATPIRFTLKDGKFKVSSGDQDKKNGEYKLDPEASPKSIDLIGEVHVSPGIYELDGDKLKVCIAEGTGAIRPTEMKADGKRIAVMTFKRVKADK